MKHRFSVFICFLGMAVASATGQSRPISSTELMAWLASGISSSRLVRIVQQSGIAGIPGKDEIQQLESAGAEANLVEVLTTSRPSAAPVSSTSKDESAEIPSLLVQAAAAARAQQFHQAELDFRQLLKSDPENAALHFGLGTMLRQQERWDDAYEEIALSVRLMPDFPENHNALAYIFFRLDDGPNAIAEARTALSMDPRNAEGYQMLGLGLYSAEQYGAAAHALMESLARDLGNSDTYYDLGIVLHADKNPAGAILAYRHAIKLNPAFWQARSNLALILHEENNFDEAIAEYQEAKRLAPEEASVRNNLGNTLCDKGSFDAAVLEFRELYREHPEWQQGHTCLARAYMAKKDYGSAIEELQIAVRQNPSGSAEHRALGEALLLGNKPEEAVRELRLAVALNPDSDSAHQALGTALFQLQQPAAAEKEFREALRLNPSADHHYSLAACLMSLDRYAEALSELDAAAQLDPKRQLYRTRRDELVKLMKETSSR